MPLTRTNACPPQNNFAPVYPNGFDISPALRQALVQSVSCGDPELIGFINANFDTIACLNRVQPCIFPNILVLRLQVGLADLALDAARNLVDQFATRGNGSGESHFRSSSYRDAESSRESQGTSKFKSRGNSFNNFQRTSEAHERASSTSRSQADGRFTNEGTDTSRRQQNSTTRSFDKAVGEGEGTGNGTSFYASTRASSATSQTSPNPSFPGIFPVPVPAFASANGNFPGVATTTAIRGEFVFATPLRPTCAPQVPNPGNTSQVNCGVVSPSVGAGFKSTLRRNGSLGIVIPLINVSLVTGWDITEASSGHFRVQQVCSRGGGSSDATSRSQITYNQFDETRATGQTNLLGTGFDQRRVQRAGFSERTSTSKLHAESSGRMDSCGESHSFSTRQAHGEAQNTGASRARTESHGETEGKFLNRSRSLSTARYFNQIFQQLKELRKLFFSRMQEQEAIARASRGGLSTCAPARRLTAAPLFFYANRMVCVGCFQSGCKGCNGERRPGYAVRV